MASDLEQLQTIKTQTLQLIADITKNPKPNYNIDGQQVSWATYLAQLQATLKWVNDQIDREEGPYEERTELIL